MRKALLYQLMNNLNGVISKTDLTHREISNGIGNADNWFNDAYNNNEDIYISSFIRVLSVIDKEFTLVNYNLINLFDENILKIASLMDALSNEEDAYVIKFIEADLSTFIGLVANWKSMDYRNKLNDIEKESLEKIDIDKILQQP